MVDSYWGKEPNAHKSGSISGAAAINRPKEVSPVTVDGGRLQPKSGSFAVCMIAFARVHVLDDWGRAPVHGPNPFGAYWVKQGTEYSESDEDSAECTRGVVECEGDR